MAEAIPGVNVQALTAFFSKHFEPSKTNTQPRRIVQKNKAFSKLLEFSSKQDLTTCRNANPPTFCRSVSAFDLPNVGTFPHIAKNWETLSKRKQYLNKTLATSVIPNNSICASANSHQGINYKLDAGSNNSDIEKSSEKNVSRDNRQPDKLNFPSVRNSTISSWNTHIQNSLSSKNNNEINSQRPPTVNIIIKNPSVENHKHMQTYTDTNKRNVMTTVWNRTYEVDISTEIEKNLTDKSDKLFYSEIVISENYVYKAQYKRTELPSTELLGPPPSKPKKLDNTLLLSLFPTSKCEPFQKQLVSSRIGKISFPQDISCNKYRQRTVSDVTLKNSHWYQQGKYCESVKNTYDDRKENIPLSKPPSLPPRRLSCPTYLQEKNGSSLPDVPGEELYQDTEIDNDKVYEEVPFPSNFQPHLYVNHAKPGKTSKEIARLWQKEHARQERELEKLKKKFGITGEEVPLEKGYIKNDAKGGRGDLGVKKGEAVLIMRIEDNPIGRLLVQNERGKIGYVALDNLTVDADSLKTVMRERKHSLGNKEGRHSNTSNGEAIYEEC